MSNKIITILLVISVCINLTACGGNNIEKFCDGGSIRWDGYEGQNNDESVYYALFENGVLTIEYRVAEDSSNSPTGKLMILEDSEEYNYELKGNDTVIIDGETYTYEIENDRVKFNKALMGIESYWKR